jgi:Peptidase family C25
MSLSSLVVRSSPVRPLFYCALALFTMTCAMLLGSGHVSAASSSTTQLLKIQGGGAAKENGDYVASENTSNATTGLNTFYVFYIEVPSGLANLNVDLFDADFGQGAANDAQRNGSFANSSTVYTLLNPTGGTVATTTGDSAGPAGSNNAWLSLASVANPANGHWELRVDSSASTGDDVNGFGIRAYNGAGNEGAAGVELPIYADTMVQVGNTVNNTTLVTTLYPWVTADCTIDGNDFDFDVGGGGALGGTVSLSNRLGTSVSLGATFSANDVWVNTSAALGDSNTNRNAAGIWSADLSLTTTGSNNYGNVYFGNTLTVNSDTTAPTVVAPTDTYRMYLPSDAGGTPTKPYLAQYYIFQAGANPPVNGSNTDVTVVVLVTNSTQRAITFSATNLVRSTAPVNGRTSYQDASTVTQGAIVTEPAIGNDGDITWNPGTLAAGGTAVMTYRMRFSPNAAAQTRDLVGPFGTNGTRATWLDETGNAAQARATYSFGQLCGMQISTGVTVPTPVSLAAFSSQRTGANIVASWSTATETQNVGFRIVPDGMSEILAKAQLLVPSRVVDSVEPQAYNVVVPSNAKRVWLEDIDTQGNTKRHGPYQVGKSYGEKPEPEAIDWKQAKSLLDKSVKQRSKTAHSAAILEVKQRGIHRVTYEALITAGVNLSGVPAASIAVSNELLPVARRVAGAEIFGPGSYIEFIGVPGTDLYGKKRSYLLSVDASRVLDVQIDRSRPGRVAAATFDGVSVLDPQRYYSFASPNGDPWFADRMLALKNTPALLPLHLDLPGRVGNAPVTVRVAVWGVTDWSGSAPDHSLNVLSRGGVAASWNGDGLSSTRIDFEIVPRHAQQLELELELTGATGYDYDLVNLESVRAEYRTQALARDLIFNGRGLALDAAADGFYVSGFHSYDLSAYRQDESGLVYLPDLAPRFGIACCAVDLPKGADNAEYWVAQQSAIATPSIRALATPVPLPDAETDYLIITHPLFSTTINRLAEHHRSQGLRVATVETDAIYRSVSDGATKVQAIDDFIAYAVTTLKVRYVLLVGGDTYDYDDNLGLGSISFIPTQYRQLNDVVRYAPTDAPYADIDDDLRPDVALGRLPVRTPAQLDRAIDKLLSQTTAARSLDAFFIAAAAEPGVNFAERADRLRAALDGERISSDLLRVDAMGIDSARTKMMSTLQTGPALVTYVGHSGVDRWSFDPLLTATEASQLGNVGAPSVFVQWGCWNTYFVSPYFNSMADALLFGSGGASSVIGAAALTDASGHQALGLQMYPLLSTGERLGDALLRAKRAIDPDAEYFRETSLGVNLLGDPAAKVF